MHELIFFILYIFLSQYDVIRDILSPVSHNYFTNLIVEQSAHYWCYAYTAPRVVLILYIAYILYIMLSSVINW